MSVIIHPFYFPKLFAKDPRLVWMPIGSYYDRLIGGEHNLVPASKRSVVCQFIGSHKKGGGHRAKFFAAFNPTASQKNPPTRQNLCQVKSTAGFTKGLQGNAYAHQLLDMSFALCPGGVSVETLRLYEALENGAIPVMVQADYDFGKFAFTHPHNQFLVVPSWNETNAILASWQDPARRLDLDLLQRRNVQWYRRFKDAVALHLRMFLMDRIFNTYIPLYALQ